MTLPLETEVFENEDRLHNPVNYPRASAKEKQQWIKEAFSVCSINLKLENISDVPAKDLKIKTEIADAKENVAILDDFPSKPQGFELPALPSKDFPVKGTSIHPQDTHLEEKIIYLRPKCSGVADLTVTVYGENLPSPLTFNLKLHFLVEKKTLPPKCLNDELWERLEEDVIFEILNDKSFT